MAERILHPEFRDELEFTRYPFADGATLTADTGQQIELDTFLDASLYPIGAQARLHINRVIVTLNQVTITLADSTRNERASAVFDPLAPPDLLLFADDFGRPAGLMVSEVLRMSRFSAWDVGTHRFTQAAAELAASCVIPTPERGVRAVQDAEDNLLTGDLWLLGDNGVAVREEDGHIRVDIVGDPLFVRKLCTPLRLFTVPNFIRTINGCPPDQYGNYNLTVGDHFNQETIVRIYADNGGLVIEAVGDINTQRGN